MDNNQYKRFNYQSSAKDLGVFFKKTIGMHLFKMHQGRRFTNKKVCEDLGINIETLDKIEIGNGDIPWSTISKLLSYYRVLVHMTLEKNHFYDEQQIPKVDSQS